MAGCATRDPSGVAASAGVAGFRLGGLPLRVAFGPPGVALAAAPVGLRARLEDERVLDHLSIQCSDVPSSATFYDAALGALGAGRVMDFGTVIGYGVAGKPSFWLGPLAADVPNREVHVAFRAVDRAGVRAFFEAARRAGAEVLHEPRVWPEYHPDYYGAFVRDPDGNNVEAVCHAPE